MIQPDVFVELLRQYGVKIMTRKLCFRSIDDPDCTLEPRLTQRLSTVHGTLPQIEAETAHSRLVAAMLVTLRNRG